MNRQLEHMEQTMLVTDLRVMYPNLLFWATPNGGKRDIKTAVSLKEEGVIAGVPDLFFPAQKLFIEMKAKGGRVSKAQDAMHKRLTECGYSVLVCYSAEEAMKELATLL